MTFRGPHGRRAKGSACPNRQGAERARTYEQMFLLEIWMEHRQRAQRDFTGSFEGHKVTVREGEKQNP